ncbi:MAG: TonB-dependent receptor plug domain-containing protein [Flavobacteriales bacterium]|nr:TonB-dependent receptor plug domain-containing protein [Flavobacteriales bacterium]
MRVFFLVILSSFSYALFGQDVFELSGSITDEEQNGLTDVVIIEDDKTIGFSNSNGTYRISLKANVRHVLIFSYQLSSKQIVLEPQKAGVQVVRNLTFRTTVELPTAGVQHKRFREKVSVITMDPHISVEFPSVQFEDVLTKVGLGVTQAGGELSSAYNVRGGNFDENLIYVNGIEIFRPFLVRSGQQEGLSFINPDMTENVSFSAGGFEARYGDKMSSVLDVQYIDPKKFGAGANLSFMGVSAYAHDISKDRRFSYNVGVRYRTNQYLLNSLDVQGSYNPNFTDIQSLLSYRLNSKLRMSWLSSYARNNFRLEPESRSTSFGTVQNALRLFVAFGGAELTRYETFVNGLTFTYQPNDSNRIEWISSTYTSRQLEYFTIEGAYRLDELENNLGSDDFGESRLTLGLGYFINHARNKLDIRVHNHQVKGTHYRGSSTFEWGAMMQFDQMEDRLREWNYNDSSGYNVARGRSDTAIYLDDVLRTNIELTGVRTSGFLQWTHILDQHNDMRVNVGIRGNYWNVNEQFVFSPRGQLSFKPNKRYNDRIYSKITEPRLRDSLLRKDWLLKVAAGLYAQPPFYRELRDLSGVLNLNLRAQKAVHFVFGGDMLFTAWNRPFRFIGEVYHKQLYDLVPYFLDNVRIRYDALNNSKGHSSGLDLRVNGEFIKDLESWVNISFLSTRERITYTDASGVQQNTGNIRRPTDQRFHGSILFRDELKTDPSVKMHLNLVFGTGLPYYFNGPYRYEERFGIPAYRRVDIGFSKELIDFSKKLTERRLSGLQSFWISLEVFNLLQVNNTISYIWVEDLNNNLYGVPNYLTGRRLNLKLLVKI